MFRPFICTGVCSPHVAHGCSSRITGAVMCTDGLTGKLPPPTPAPPPLWPPTDNLQCRTQGLTLHPGVGGVGVGWGLTRVPDIDRRRERDWISSRSFFLHQVQFQNSVVRQPQYSHSLKCFFVTCMANVSIVLPVCVCDLCICHLSILLPTVHFLW